jgi:hypothetical protein
MRYHLLFCCLFILPLFTYSQTEKDLLTADSIVYYGVDFSFAKYMSPKYDENLKEIKDIYFPAINYVILDEPKKFNFEKYLHKNKIIRIIDIVNKRNAAIDESKLRIEVDTFKVSIENIENALKQYDCGKMTGIGLVIFIQKLSKSEDKAEMNFIFFNIETKTILLNKYFSKHPGGFGFRNYWVNTIYKALKDFEY